MAQRVFGIDLGAHSVKISELDVGFRAQSLVAVRHYEVQLHPDAPLARSLEALPESLSLGAHDVVAVGLPGDRAIMRLFDLPITDPRKLAAVVASELEDDIPWELEEIVHDHATTAVDGKVLVAAARQEEVSSLIEQLAERGVSPRQVAVGPLGYAGIARRLYADEDVLLVDIGHLRTNVCLLSQGKPLLARTISRGGFQITEQLREVFHLGYREAEQFKHTRALLVADPDTLDPASRRVAHATEQAVVPLTRELKRALALFYGRSGVTPARVVLCGGTSQLSGLDSYLHIELGLPVERLDFAADEQLATSAGAASAGDRLSGALSVGLALEAGRRGAVDLRQGQFAFQTDGSILREKILALSISAALLVSFAGLSAFASHRALKKEHQGLERELADATRSIFGKPLTDPYAVTQRLKRNLKKGGGGVPKLTAFDMLDVVSRHVPPKDQAKLDVSRMEIKAGKTTLRATADSGAAIGKIVKSLQGYACFEKVSSGKISGVAGGAKEFSLTIITKKCF
jgi:general secretion pathway protein L